jgi:FeS assembly SUF system protein
MSGQPTTAELLRESILNTIRTIYDPEIPVNIYEIGLIYGLDVDESGAVAIKMTLTSPACPVATTLPPEVEQKVRDVPGVTSCHVEVVWDPPWNPNMMTEAAKLQLGFL